MFSTLILSLALSNPEATPQSQQDKSLATKMAHCGTHMEVIDTLIGLMAKTIRGPSELPGGCTIGSILPFQVEILGYWPPAHKSFMIVQFRDYTGNVRYTFYVAPVAQ